MTEAEFVAWCDSDTWAEWVDGEVILMSPVNYEHARLVTFFIRLIGDFVERRGLGEVLTEPFQVRFANLRRRRAPDLIFVSTRLQRLIKAVHFEGGPDLVLEVVSPDSQSRDRRDKYADYEAAGVREYWIVDPISQTVEAYARSRTGAYRQLPQKEGSLTSAVLRGFRLKPEVLWRKKLPSVTSLLREMAKAR